MYFTGNISSKISQCFRYFASKNTDDAINIVLIIINFASSNYVTVSCDKNYNSNATDGKQLVNVLWVLYVVVQFLEMKVKVLRFISKNNPENRAIKMQYSPA